MKTSGILACTTILSPVIFHTLVVASSFEPLPELAPRKAAATQRVLVLPPAPPNAPELPDLARRSVGSDGRITAPTSRGRDLALFLAPAWQTQAERLLAETDASLGGVVVMDLDGRVLALAGRSAKTGDRPDLALDPWAPSASVFKVVTAAALVDAGVSPRAEVCVHGGAGGLVADNLVDDARRDDRCASLAAALAHSNNAIVGKLAARTLRSDVLARYAAAFGYNRPVPFGRPSTADIPDGPLELARTAAGFWHSDLSPVGGAVVAATLASGGLAVTPRIFDDGEPAVAPPRVLAAETARSVAAMLAGTTELGTARTAFHDGRGRPYLRVRVAGKTGTLSRRPVAGLAPLDFSWFVGFAPADHPEVVISVLVAASPRRPARAATLARRILAEKYGRSSAPAW
jgi:cell division protein FtsI/penicillin-binding protein 2